LKATPERKKVSLVDREVEICVVREDLKGGKRPKKEKGF